jgi:hypothetical protein
MSLMDREIKGGSGSEASVEPVLLTRDNLDSAEIRQIENMSWWPSP